MRSVYCTRLKNCPRWDACCPDRRHSPSSMTQGAPTSSEQTRPKVKTPPPQQASLPVKLSPPSLPLQPTPAIKSTARVGFCGAQQCVVETRHPLQSGERGERPTRHWTPLALLVYYGVIDLVSIIRVLEQIHTSALSAAKRAAGVLVHNPGNAVDAH